VYTYKYSVPRKIVTTTSGPKSQRANRNSKRRSRRKKRRSIKKQWFLFATFLLFLCNRAGWFRFPENLSDILRFSLSPTPRLPARELARAKVAFRHSNPESHSFSLSLLKPTLSPSDVNVFLYPTL